MNQLRVPDRLDKCPLMRRAQPNQQAHYIAVVCMALDQNGPEQNGLKQMFRPPASTHGSSSRNLGPNDSLAQHVGASTPARHAKQAHMQELNNSSAQSRGAHTPNLTMSWGMLWLEATCLRVANKFACHSMNHIQSACFKQWHSVISRFQYN